MRNKLPYLASLSVLWAALAIGQQDSVEKTTKPAAKSDEKAAKQEKETAKPSALATDKQTAGEVKLGVSSDAEKQLDKAIEMVEALTQFRCHFRQTTEMLGYRFSADGQYAIAPEHKMLFELKVNLTDTTGTVKEVCDGRTHWRNQKIFDEQELVKTDLKKIGEILNNPKFTKEERDQFYRGLGFSGMVPLMRGLRESLKIDIFEEETLYDLPVYVMNGQWEEKVMSQASFRGQPLSASELPIKHPYIPSKITLWIGREDGWLHKVEMEGSKKVQGALTKVTLEFLDPQIGVQLPESMFAFEPPAGVKPKDQTDFLSQRLNLYLQQSPSTKTPAGSSSSTGEKSKTKSSANEPEPATKSGSGEKP